MVLRAEVMVASLVLGGGNIFLTLGKNVIYSDDVFLPLPVAKMLHSAQLVCVRVCKFSGGEGLLRHSLEWPDSKACYGGQKKVAEATRAARRGSFPILKPSAVCPIPYANRQYSIVTETSSL